MRRDARRFPPPGQFVRVEPVRRLHYVCSGNGGPLVLFEVSGFSNSMSFREARAGLAQRTRVCSYDRVGIGWSDRAPSTIPVSMLAKDLGTLLDELSPRTPAVLVASSIGGLPVEFFARQHPERVAGLVFLDAGNSEAVRGAAQPELPAGARNRRLRRPSRRERHRAGADVGSVADAPRPIGTLGTLSRGDVRRQAVGDALCDGACGRGHRERIRRGAAAAPGDSDHGAERRHTRGVPATGPRWLDSAARFGRRPARNAPASGAGLCSRRVAGGAGQQPSHCQQPPAGRDRCSDRNDFPIPARSRIPRDPFSASGHTAEH